MLKKSPNTGRQVFMIMISIRQNLALLIQSIPCTRRHPHRHCCTVALEQSCTPVLERFCTVAWEHCGRIVGEHFGRIAEERCCTVVLLLVLELICIVSLEQNDIVDLLLWNIFVLAQTYNFAVEQSCRHACLWWNMTV